jgi:hypothetical protein
VYRRLHGAGTAQATTLAASFRSDDNSPHLHAFLDAFTALAPST